MDQESLRWAKELSNALKAWCKEEGVVPSELAKILGIRQTIWYSIISGRSMSSDVENYAKVYLWTSLTQADPRNVPAQKLTGVLKGNTKPRAWTGKQFDQWLRHINAQMLLKLKSVSGVALPVQDKQVYSLIEKLVMVLKPDVINIMSDEELIEALLASLIQTARGNSSVRAKWLKKNKSATKLLIVLDALLSRDSEMVLPLVLRQLEE